MPSRLWDEIASVVEVLGHQQKRWRVAAGLSAGEFGEAIGYGEDLVRKVERGARIPRPEYLDAADRVLKANGFISAMREEMAKARYPKQVRELAKLEERAVELLLYCNHNLHGLLQTKEYMRALYDMRQPALTEDVVDREVEARLSRQSIYERSPAPAFGFVLEESALLRPLGGGMVWRRQLEHLLEVGRNMTLNPTARDARELKWFKSSYSSGSEGDSCVEVAPTLTTIHVRDSKNRQGPHLAFAAGAWHQFVQAATS